MINIFKPQNAAEKSSEEPEICVLCGQKTLYRCNVPITDRFGYVDGVGQLCWQCYAELHPKDAAGIDKSSLRNRKNTSLYID